MACATQARTRQDTRQHRRLFSGGVIDDALLEDLEMALIGPTSAW